ncbi:prolyl 4-hydroxylase subunit alpha-2-like [Triplophysa dalaica]|uniref:prolyl 4-hydroxylase subunit alpha-2-like n=1 Tax=Triplophysa dalaica TaxID=1582913 RepID=UPI0024E02EF9|nr:prolyl 4-hydroxylase subunit alpha-2-like [Triplophysa dalaica]
MFGDLDVLKMATMKLLSFVACVWVFSAGHELFSSMDQAMQLVEEKRNLLEHFNSYINAEEENLQRLRRGLEILRQLPYFKDPENTTTDPVAAYKLMRQLRILWLTIITTTENNPYDDFQELLFSDVLKIPSEEDLESAALALIKLQETYKLYPVNLTKETPLTENEAYYLGLKATVEDKFQHAFHWFLYTLKMFNETKSFNSIRTFTKERLLEHLGSSAYHFGSLPVAIYFYQQLLKLDPTNEDVKSTLKLCRNLRLYRTSNPDIFTLNKESTNSYEALCRGKVKPRTSRRQSTLSCRYSTGGGNPRLILAPLKEEIEWDEPRIIRYHDIISDKEIEILKNISRPLLRRSMVGSGSGKVSNVRLSQSVFLEEDDMVYRVNQRIADATGLSMETAELLHVQNYGIGGRYETHYDAGDNQNERIATFLIYMSDVEIGGATVFPKVGVALQPKKGSAVFWYNLHKNGDLDLRTAHAGCPVLV